MATLDRRAFLTRAAVAGGGLMSMGAVERLVARDARGNPKPPGATPYGPLRRVRDPRRRLGPGETSKRCNLRVISNFRRRDRRQR